MNIDNTIAAISTPNGEGGISVIRISGKDAIVIADKIFKSAKKLLKNANLYCIKIKRFVEINQYVR